MFWPGAVVAERYQLDRLIGAGGMGSVWAATHLVTKKEVALKFLLAQNAKDEASVKRFLREARAASAVRHPNVVEIHDVIELDDGSPAMVMDLLVGETLAARLAREKSLPLADLAALMVPVISAIGTAHALGIVHRDLKPENIFLERTVDGQTIPKVLDFGIAKLSATEGAAAHTADLTNTGSVMGTPYYMAPEQVFGEKDVDQRADVWSIGAILYEALAGNKPVNGDNFGQILKVITTGAITPLATVLPTLPEEVTSLVTRMLTADRQRRPSDLREVFEILRRYTDAAAKTFPALDRHVAQPSSGASVEAVSGGTQRVELGAIAFAPTQAGSSDPALMPTEALEAFSRTRTAPGLERPRKPSRVAWFAGLGALGVAAVGAVFATRSPEPPTVPSAATSSVPEPPRVESAAPSLPTSEAPPVPSASAAVVTSAAASSHTQHGKLSVKPPPSASVPVAVPVQSAADSKKSLGGVAEKAPF